MAKPWHTVACLVQLRDEFNALSPGRDKGADGTIGDRVHKLSKSDHNVDDGSDQGRTPYEDADSDPEVHALDIDSTGAWPPGTDLSNYVDHIVDEHRWGRDNRLQNVIYRGRIASRSWGWTWQTRSGLGHFDHAHFSARYTSSAEDDERSFGLAEVAAAARPAPPKPAPQPQEDTVADEIVEITEACAKRIGKQPGEKVKLSLLVQYAIIGAYDAKAEVAELAARITPDDAKVPEKATVAKTATS